METSVVATWLEDARPDGRLRVSGATLRVSRATAALLKHRHRIIGSRVTMAGDDDVVLRLSVEELVVGVREGFLALSALHDRGGVSIDVVSTLCGIVDAPDTETSDALDMDPADRLRVRVFADLWRRGFFVAHGSKFGVDFLIYDADPDTCHARVLVLVKEWTAGFGTVDIVTHCRLAKMVNKEIHFASARPDGSIAYVSLEHALLSARH
ncbi:hypothetical protein PINS_up003854 [Pythium insidiosum]|nr:hypothetical protein PINS_up003854 [Pythium insidiosum]